MRPDFSEPKRQSAAGVAIMFANHLQQSIRILIFPIILIVVRVKSVSPWYIVAAIAVFLVLLIIFSYLSYLKFTFFLDEEKQEFIIDHGILSREHLSIRLDKIQQVNINQSLIQQIVGVYSLDIDTAGSDKKEASIKAIDHYTATILRERLLNRAISDADQMQEGQEPENNSPFLKLSIPTLFKVGLTSNYGASIALLGGFVYAIMESLKNYTEAFQLEQNPILALTSKGFGLLSLCVLFIMAILILLATNVIRNFVKYYNFEVIRKKDFLTIASGLFDKKHTLLKPVRVQISTYSQNYFQKKFNLLNMKIKQASYGHADGDHENNKKQDIDIPGCDDTERDAILKMIFDRLPEKETVFVPNYRFLFKNVMFVIVIPALLFLAAGYWFFPMLKTYFGLMIPYAVILGLMLYFEFSHHRLYISDGFIVKKSGIWDIEHQILEPHKIQSITTKQYFWHKKAGIGHLVLHTAAGSIHFNYGNYADIHRMANYWLFKVESGKKDWM